MLGDYFFLSLRSLRKRKMRSWLTMIGIFIGIAAVVSLISIGQGMKGAIFEQFEAMGANKITILAGSGFMGPMSGLSAAELTDDDVEVIERVRGIDLVAGLIATQSQAEFKEEVQFTWISGIPVDERRKIIEEMQNFDIAKGRHLKSGDRYKVVIGELVADGKVFEKKVALRDKIIISDQEFKVVGILESIGNSQDDSSLIIPLETARDVFNEPEELTMIIAQTKLGFEPADIAEDIEKALRKSRDVEEDEEDFSVSTSEQLLESFGTILNIVQIVLVGIAAISLLVGGIGIMNTMYMSVLERTKEVGIMKSLGARNMDILFLFLFESGLLGIAGGVIGIVIGIGISKSVELIALMSGFGLLKAVFPLYLIVGALLFSFVVGAVSGVFPAIRASRMKPVDALRYE